MLHQIGVSVWKNHAGTSAKSWGHVTSGRRKTS